MQLAADFLDVLLEREAQIFLERGAVGVDGANDENITMFVCRPFQRQRVTVRWRPWPLGSCGYFLCHNSSFGRTAVQSQVRSPSAKSLPFHRGGGF